jgi:hypothetical protein
MLSAPTSTAPAASSRCTSTASCEAAGLSRSIFEPASVGRPATSNRFFTAKGTPSSGSARVASPSGEASAWSSAAARLRARPPVTSVKALTRVSVKAMRARLACTSALTLTEPARTALAMAEASFNNRASAFIACPRGIHRCKHHGRIVVRRERHGVQQGRELCSQREVTDHAGPVLRLQRQAHSQGCGVHIGFDLGRRHGVL